MYKNIVDQMKCYERLRLINWTNKAKLLAARQMDSNILVCTGTNGNITTILYLILISSNIIN